MSVYLKSIEMPTSCCECFAFKSNADGYLFCKAKRIAFGKEDAEWLPLKTPNWCPLIPVPEHGRLIDADALMAYFENIADIEWNKKAAPISWSYAFEDVMDDIENAPTIIPADPAKEGEG